MEKMEKIRKDAMAYYISLSKKQQDTVFAFFKSLDTDGNGSISVSELAEFLADEGIYICDSPVDTFRMFDRDGNGSLNIYEVITLFYYLTVGPGAKKSPITRSADSKNLEKWKKPRETLLLLLATCRVGVAIFIAVGPACSIL